MEKMASSFGGRRGLNSRRAAKSDKYFERVVWRNRRGTLAGLFTDFEYHVAFARQERFFICIRTKGNRIIPRPTTTTIARFTARDRALA